MVKPIILLNALLCLLSSAFASEDSVTTGNAGWSFTGFIAPEIKVSPVNKQTGIMLGGRACLLVNSVFSIGGGGYTLVNSVSGDNEEQSRLDFHYGGLILDWYFMPFELVHGGFSLLLGEGLLDLDIKSTNADRFFVIEPEWFFQGNVTTWLQVDLGVAFRIVREVERFVDNNWNLSHVSGSLRFKFGKFKIDYYQ